MQGTIRRIMVAVMAGLLTMPPAGAARSNSNCDSWFVTGYVRGEGSAYTADGTSVWSGEAVAAAPYWVPFGTYVTVDGLGTYRVADRGRLGERHLDVLVDTRRQAYALTGTYTVCLGG